jgi:AraC-like DNA-binding protein
MSHLTTDYFRYLPVSQRDVQWDLYVTGVGYSNVPPDSPYPSSLHPELYDFAWSQGRVLPEYQVLYITRGEGEFESEAIGKEMVAAGTVLLLFPGVWHRYRPTTEVGWEEYWLGYNGPYADRLVARAFLSPDRPVLRTGLDDAILRPYLQMLDRVRVEPAGYSQLLAAGTMEVLAAALGAARTQRDGGRLDALVRQARLVLEQQTEQPADMEALAASLKLSYAHFRRVFKQQTGMSPYQYHLQLRVHRARELLRGTTLSVKQIAARLHFESPYHFSKIFKKKTGDMSPTQWRGGGR